MIGAIDSGVRAGRYLPAQIAALVPVRATTANWPSASRPMPITLPGAQVRQPLAAGRYYHVVPGLERPARVGAADLTGA